MLQFRVHIETMREICRELDQIDMCGKQTRDSQSVDSQQDSSYVPQPSISTWWGHELTCREAMVEGKEMSW
mgnify:CR=1 FL=1